MMMMKQKIQTASILYALLTMMILCLAGKTTALSNGETHRLQIGDVIQINVMGLPKELIKEVVVGPDGEIFFPWAGSIQAAGLTRDELAEALKKKLEKFFKHFEVLVGAADIKPKFSILGKVASTGSYAYSTGMTLTEAITMAGGVAAGASYLVRVIRNNKEILSADIDKILKGNEGDLTQNIPIKPGDIIYLVEKLRNKVTVLGSVKTPGEHDLQPGWGIPEAIVTAGGLTTSAAATGGIGAIVYIQRQGFYRVTVRRDGKEIFEDYIDPLSLESRDENSDLLVLEHGDVAFIREIRYSVIVMGAVKTPYVYEFKQGDTVLDALMLAGGPQESGGGGASSLALADLKNVGVIRAAAGGKSTLLKVDLEDVIRKGDLSKNITLMDRDIVYVPSKHRKLKWDEILLKITDLKTVRDIIKGW